MSKPTYMELLAQRKLDTKLGAVVRKAVAEACQAWPPDEDAMRLWEAAKDARGYIEETILNAIADTLAKESG